MTGSPKPLHFLEMPYTFRLRTEGESKLDHVVALEYLIAIYDRLFGSFVPVRFVMFSAIGAIGAGVHFGVLAILFKAMGIGFTVSTIAATVAAMTFNFFLNNALTYRDTRLRGARQLLDGWVSFCIVCSPSALANIGVAAFLYNSRADPWEVSALAGVVLGAVWNYALSSRFTWGRY